MSSWVGYAVSVNCGEPLGCYQGTIVETDGSTITLTKAFRNGFPYPKSKVTLNAVDIKELKIIEETHGMPTEQTHSTVSVTKSNKKGQRATVCESLQANPSVVNTVGNPAASNVSSVQTGPGRSKPIDIQAPRGNKNITHSGSAGAGGAGGAGGAVVRGRGGAQEKARRRNEACFGEDAEPALLDDFDFEGNLALFDKQALWEQMRSAARPDVVRAADEAGARLRHDENVLESGPGAGASAGIAVPEALRACEYRTEAGAAVPGVAGEARRRLWAALRAWGGGAGEAARVLLARAAADVALQLVGGGRRLDWRNAHQAPVCVAVAGAHGTGATAVLAARLLASHGARAYVLLAGECGECGGCAEGEGEGAGAGAVVREVAALGAGRVRRAANLPRPDLVLLALHDPAQDADADHAHPLYQEALSWARGARGAALALEPPARGWAGLSARAAVQGVLPGALPAALGRLHLADVAPPPALFRDLGIQYRTPFAAGALLPLHPAD